MFAQRNQISGASQSTQRLKIQTVDKLFWKVEAPAQG